MFKKILDMEKKEYLTVREISDNHKMSTRNVRRIITTLEEEKNKYMIYKDANGDWLIHRLLLPKFKPQRIRKEKYYALSIDPCTNYTITDIDKIMDFVVSNTSDSNLEINYVIEQKKSNNQNHLHCYVKCSKKKKLIESIKLGFSKASYKQNDIFDLNGWKDYMSKEGNKITTIKKEL